MKKISLSTIILILVFLVGLSLLLYPTVSDYWNSLRQTMVIAEYAEQVADLDDDRYEQLWTDAENYNRSLLKKTDRYEMSGEEIEEYERLLNVSGNGIIGYIEIPTIGCRLPIYHGTDEAVLQVGVGHMEGSSLPTGGFGTHAVISGHRGLPSARLFTDLDRLVEGDMFLLYILDETLTYEVDQIRIVEPQEMDALEINPDEDYCTLVTCTPYGINTHRLLVRGRRVENAAEAGTVRVTADAIQIEPVLVASLVAVPILILLVVGILAMPRRRNHIRKGNENRRNLK